MRAAVRDPAPDPLFLGRDAELADLVRTGRAGLTSGRFLLVRGEGGIGKSTLIDAAAAQVPPERHVLRGAADAMDRRLTYGLLLDALGPVLTDEDRRLATEHDERIAGERLLSAIDAATREPLVLILEDLHWADSASLRLLARLSRRLPRLSLVIVASLRPQARHEVAPALDHLLDELGERGLLHSFELGPLPPASRSPSISREPQWANPSRAMRRRRAATRCSSPRWCDHCCATAPSPWVRIERSCAAARWAPPPRSPR
jgi:predicted ATPase